MRRFGSICDRPISGQSAADDPAATEHATVKGGSPHPPPSGSLSLRPYGQSATIESPRSRCPYDPRRRSVLAERLPTICPGLSLHGELLWKRSRGRAVSFAAATVAPARGNQWSSITKRRARVRAGGRLVSVSGPRGVPGRPQITLRPSRGASAILASWRRIQSSVSSKGIGGAIPNPCTAPQPN